MDVLIVLSFIAISYMMFSLGRSSEKKRFGAELVDNAIGRAVIPVGVLEEIDGQYYLYEKDSKNFLCQAENLEDIPAKLWENKKISLAMILYPEEYKDQAFWCINGKFKSIQVS